MGSIVTEVVGRQVEWGPFNVTRRSIIEMIVLASRATQGFVSNVSYGWMRCLSYIGLHLN